MGLLGPWLSQLPSMFPDEVGESISSDENETVDFEERYFKTRMGSNIPSVLL